MGPVLRSQFSFLFFCLLPNMHRFVETCYVGLIPQERSSGRRRRLGKISKQGNPLLRFVWNEAGAHAARRDPELNVFIVASWCRRGWGRRVWRWRASWAFACGSCCETRSIMKSSVVVDRSSQAVQPVRGCSKSGMVRTVTVRLIRLPASLRRKGVRISHHGPQ